MCCYHRKTYFRCVYEIFRSQYMFFYVLLFTSLWIHQVITIFWIDVRIFTFRSAYGVCSLPSAFPTIVPGSSLRIRAYFWSYWEQNIATIFLLQIFVFVSTITSYLLRVIFLTWYFYFFYFWFLCKWFLCQNVFLSSTSWANKNEEYASAVSISLSTQVWSKSPWISATLA